MCRGHSLSIYVRFLGKKRTYYIQTSHNDFFPITILFYENWKKNWPEKHA